MRIKLVVWIVVVLISIAMWVALSFLTVIVADKVKEYGLQKYQDGRIWMLTQLDAPTEVVISQPETAQNVDELIDRLSAEHKVSADLVRALVAVESGFKQDAIAFNPEGDKKYGKMQSAAHSYMQVRGTWANTEMCPEAIGWSDLYNAKINITCGIRIMKDALSTQRSLKLAMAVYNGGTQCVRNDVILCAESREHASRVLEQLAEVIWKKQ